MDLLFFLIRCWVIGDGLWVLVDGFWLIDDGFSIRFATRSDGGVMWQLDNEPIRQFVNEAMRQ